jgi:hypothetical protein
MLIEPKLKRKSPNTADGRNPLRRINSIIGKAENLRFISIHHVVLREKQDKM